MISRPALSRALPQGGPARFGLRFGLFLALAALLFPWTEGLFARVHLWPVAVTAEGLLGLVGIRAALDTSMLGHGHCLIDVGDATYLVNHECTGLFALFLLAGAVLAYPASGAAIARGFLLGVPALYAFGALRLVVLGVVAQLRPAWIDLFHEYVMEVVSIAFVIYIWVYWIDKVVDRVD